jgi:SGNH hydrolase-like domain, acetyltransferase AlgX
LGMKRTLLESWYTRSSVYLYLVFSRLGAFATEAHRVPTDRQGGALEWEKGTKIAQHPAELARAFPWILDPLQERATMSDETFLELEGRRGRELASRQINLYAPAFFEAMERIRSDVEGRPWAVVLIPDEFHVNDRLWKSVEGSLQNVSLNRFRAQAMVKEWAAQNQVPCLDLTDALRAAKKKDDGQRHVFHRNDTHFNVRGNSIAGRALAAFLSERFPFLRR